MKDYDSLKLKYNMLKQKKDDLEQILYDVIERYEALYKQVYGDIPVHREYTVPRTLKEEDKKLLGR